MKNQNKQRVFNNPIHKPSRVSCTPTHAGTHERGGKGGKKTKGETRAKATDTTKNGMRNSTCAPDSPWSCLPVTSVASIGRNGNDPCTAEWMSVALCVFLEFVLRRQCESVRRKTIAREWSLERHARPKPPQVFFRASRLSCPLLYEGARSDTSFSVRQRERERDAGSLTNGRTDGPTDGRDGSIHLGRHGWTNYRVECQMLRAGGGGSRSSSELQHRSWQLN